MRLLSKMGVGTGSLLCLVAASLVIALSVFINGYFAFVRLGGEMASLLAGSIPVGALVAACMFAAVDVLKAFAPLWFARSWAHKNYSHAVVCAVLLVVGVGLSGLAAYGLIMEERSGLKTERVAKSESKAALDLQLKESRERLAQLGAVRPVATVEAALEAQRQNRRWKSSAQCTDATATLSRDFCTAYNTLRAELASAQAVAKERQRAATASEKLQAIRAAGGTKVADPQLEGLSVVTGLKVTKLEAFIFLFAAGVFEFVSAFGLYFALGHGPKQEAPRATPVAPPAPPAEVAPTASPATLRPQTALLPTDTGIEPIKTVTRYGAARLVKHDGAAVGLRELHADYRAWCLEEGLTAVTLAQLAEHLRQIADEVGGIAIAKQGGRLVLLNMEFRRRLAAA